MPFIGNQPALSYTSFAKQDFSTSATTSYTLDNPVANANELALFINFVRQEPTTAYSASGTNLTLTSATASSDDMYCVYLGKAVQTVNPPNASVGLSQLTASGTKNSTTFLRGDNTFASAQGVYESQLLHIRDEKSNNTHGGTFTSGAWQQRDLNTIKTNEITGASLSSSNITLPSGTYYIEALAPAIECGAHKAKLYNTTDSSDVIIGTNKHNRSDNNYAISTSDITGRFTISAEKVFMIAHRCATTRSNDGFGIASNFSVIEVYSDVKIWKVA